MKHLLSLYQDLQFVNCRVRHFLPFFLGDVYILRAASLSWSVCARWTDILRDFCRRHGVRGWKQDFEDDLGVPWYVRVFSKTWNWTAIKSTETHLITHTSLSLSLYIEKTYLVPQKQPWWIPSLKKIGKFAGNSPNICRFGLQLEKRGRVVFLGKPKDSVWGGLGKP